MRPEQLQIFLKELLPTARTFEETGEKKYPFGVVIPRPHGEDRWHLIGQLSPAEKHDTPAPATTGAPTEGPPPPDTAPAAEWLAATLTAAAHPEIATVTARPTTSGLTIDYHNGAKTFVRAV
ncbi:hypothetical protein [Streptomyces sp. NPDC047046]|uniref:hypothetical protein n=1 Tax=Streptomyces sp. NPDC047046 TaxID=3155378 RepID=UPI0033CE04A4